MSKASATPDPSNGKRVGLALGGGGAKGLAHVRILEVFDELGIRPAMIAGSSIGAVIGALYAGGISGREIRASIEAFVYGKVRSDAKRKFSLAESYQRLLGVLDVDLSSGGLLRGEKFLDRLYEDMPARRFEELEIPLKVVVTDFWARDEVVIESGLLRPAVRASMALPVLFSPVELDGRIMIDGGTRNPVPFDLLQAECDVTIAVDVGGSRRAAGEESTPSLIDSVFNTFQIMSRAIVDEKLLRCPPDLHLRPDIVDVQALEFDRAEEIFAAADDVCAELAATLPKLLA